MPFGISPRPLPVLLVLALLAVPASAGWIGFEPEGGLVPGDTRALLGDSRGRMWVGKDQGLSRFDGLAWEQVSDGDRFDDGVNVLLEDGAGALWIGSARGLLARIDGEWVRFSGAVVDTADVLAMLETEMGLVASTRGGGLWENNGSAWVSLAFPGTDATSLFVDGGDRLWAGAEDGLYVHEQGAWRRDTPPGQPQNEQYTVFGGTGGEVWTSGSVAVARRRNGVWESFEGVANAPGRRTVSLVSTPDGVVWAATGEALHRFDGTAWSRIQDIEKVPPDVAGLRVDREGRLWAFSPTQPQISRHDGFFWRTFGAADGVRGLGVAVATQDLSGALWFGAIRPGSIGRFDGAFWQSFGPEQGLPAIRVNDILVRPDGTLLLGTSSGPVSYDGDRFGLLSTAGLLDRNILSLDEAGDSLRVATGAEIALRVGDGPWERELGRLTHVIYRDPDDGLWAGTDVGAFRLVGSTWTQITEGALENRDVWDITRDDAGRMWFGHSGGLSRLDGDTWKLFNPSNGLPSATVLSVLEAKDGRIWIGTDSAPAVWDGTTWKSFGSEDGLTIQTYRTVFEDLQGTLWFGTADGASRFDGQRWRSFSPADGLGAVLVSGVAEDARGNLLFGGSALPDGSGGLSVHQEDRIPPLTVFSPVPPRESASPRQVVTYQAGFNETGVEFSWRLDELGWSAWIRQSFFVLPNLPDGDHRIEIRGRDRLGNVEDPPARASVTIDATPPQPSIVFPPAGNAVGGTVAILGSTEDARFVRYAVQVLRPGSTEFQTLVESAEPVVDGVLAEWKTIGETEGAYDLRVVVEQNLGPPAGVAIVRGVVVDNEAPFNEVTTPVRIRAADGGDVFTTFSEAHVHLAPRALDEDAVVSLDEIQDSHERFRRGYAVSLGEASLVKPALLEMDGRNLDAPLDFLVIHRRDESGWVPLGGTPDMARKLVSLTIEEPGVYGLFAGRVREPGVSAVLSALRVIPRVLRVATGMDAAAIAFSVGHPGTVSVTVYSRSGRRVRRVAESHFSQGSHVVPWDGRTDDGVLVDDGMYIVTVDTQGDRLTQTVAVVR